MESNQKIGFGTGDSRYRDNSLSSILTNLPCIKAIICQRCILCILFLTTLGNGFTVKASYPYAVKSKLVYEVTSVSLQGASYVMEGWAFINENQHYINSSDMEGQVALRNHIGVIVFPITFHDLDMTYLMKMDSRRRCGDNEYFKPANECYYDYKHVKFRAVIPFEQLEDNMTYTIQLQLHAKKTDTKYGIDMFFVSSDPLKTTHNNRTISINALLDQTYFYINHNYVLARKSASKTSAIYQEATSCSAAFGRDHYFEYLSQYFNIQQVMKISNVSWYQVMTRHKYCASIGFHFVEEGGTNPTWVPSSFIEYNGAPAMIEVRKDNTPPVLLVTNPTIYVGDTTFRSEDYVEAFDLEDGALIPTKGIGNINIHKIGTYMQEYIAIDSHGLRTTKVMIVRVIDKPANTPPVITAKNRTIYQYSIFNPLEGVTANDMEEGDLTSKVIPQNTINTSLLGNHNLCFYVADQEGLNDERCVVITVIPFPTYSTTTNLRFIDAQRLFYREPIPALWNGKQFLIENALQKSVPLLSIRLR